MMVLFVDVDSRKIVLYGEEGVIRIPFEDAGKMYSYIEEEEILYVTNAVHTKVQDVINMIKGMGVKVKEEEVIVDNGVKYLYSPAKGTIYINEFLKFQGEFDIKPIDEAMNSILQSNKLLQLLIKTKKIEIIGEIKRRKILLKYKEYQIEIAEKQQRVDQGLDDIIVKSSAREAAEGGILIGGHEGAEEINILSGGSSVEGGRVNTMSDLMREIEGLEG